MITTIRFNGVGISAHASLLTGGTSAFPRNAVGFMHMLERQLKKYSLSLGSGRSVAVGVENYRLHRGEKNHVSPKMSLSKPWKSQSEIAISVLDYEWKCNATITLVVKSSGGDDPVKVREALELIIPSMRFTNGSIFVTSKFVEVLNGNDSDVLKRSIRAVKASRSSFITSRDDLIEPGHEFKSFSDALALFDTEFEAENFDELQSSVQEPDKTEQDNEEDQPDVKRKWVRNQSGWIVPIERGYQCATKAVVNRPASRDCSVDTFVVTPVIGIGEFVSTKYFLSKLDMNTFWTSVSDRSQGFFLFSAKSFNNS